MAKIDIVVPCYQYGRFLRGCVESALSQGIADLRVLIIDNASTDDSVEIARQLASEDRRIEIAMHPRNLGATASYNEGIEWAAAEFFMVLDADDMLAPGALASALSIMEAQPEISFAHGVEQHILADDSVAAYTPQPAGRRWHTISGRQYIERFCAFPENFVGASTVIRRTAAQKKAGYYRPELPFTDDVEMWLRLATLGAVASTDSVQALRRIHPHQISAVDQHSILRDLIEREAALRSFFANEGKALPDARRLFRKARRRLGEQAYWTGASHLCKGRVGSGARLFGFSLRRRPVSVVLPPVGYLFRLEKPLARIARVLRTALQKIVPRQASRAAAAGHEAR